MPSIRTFLALALTLLVLPVGACAASETASRADALPADARAVTVTLDDDEEVLASPSGALELCDDLQQLGVDAWWVPRSDERAVLVLHAGAEHAHTLLRDHVEQAIAARAAIELELRDGLVVRKVDTGSAWHVVFEGVSEPALTWLQGQLQRRVEANPQSARRVTVARVGQTVEMRLPEGGGMVRSRTSSAADDIVSRWTDREPSAFALSTTRGPFIAVLVEFPEPERLGDLRQEVALALRLCQSAVPYASPEPHGPAGDEAPHQGASADVGAAPEAAPATGSAAP